MDAPPEISLRRYGIYAASFYEFRERRYDEYRPVVE
jgi:hypothetical protein